jgi:hypothetical protein
MPWHPLGNDLTLGLADRLVLLVRKPHWLRPFTTTIPHLPSHLVLFVRKPHLAPIPICRSILCRTISPRLDALVPSWERPLAAITILRPL